MVQSAAQRSGNTHDALCGELMPEKSGREVLDGMEKSNLRILVVDDEESIRSVLVQVLEAEGYQVTAAASGVEALQAYHADAHHLVITDIKMPNLSGIDLLIEIKKQNPDTEVVIITSHASLDTALSAIRHGAYDYILKPFEDIDLIAAVAKRATEKILLTAENRDLLETLKQKKEELEEANKYLRQLVVRDALTGVYNHRYFHEALAHELKQSHRYEHPCSLIFFDVDNFKLYNDANGHPQGDEFLQALAKAVLGRLRQSDIFARYGGEEFVIILPETPREMAIKLAENLRAHVEKLPFVGREVMPGGVLTVSIGVATFPQDGEDAAALIKRADAAMYEAKRAGKNQVR
jgi:diguanylate cyclase (GGDEF)-like protein